MRLDEYGFPLPADFDDKAKSRGLPGAVTGRRLALLFVALLIASAMAVFVEFRPEIEQKLAQLLHLKDRDAMALQQAMVVAMQQGRFGEAADLCGKLAKLQPNNLQLRFAQVQLYAQAGQWQKALAVCDDLQAKFPKDGRTLNMKASILAKCKNYKGAVKACDKMLALDPGDPTALNNRAYFRALARIDLKDALDDVQKALDQDPDNETFLDTRAYLYYLFGRYDEALADYNRILADGGKRIRGLDDMGEIYFHRGLLYKQMGDERKMREDYERARRAGFKIEDEPGPLVAKGANKA
jgi:tetratricopeptide (TPR) repeat protein